ncbi:MAG: T9SS type A sorting domain-containing protein [bacterium]
MMINVKKKYVRCIFVVGLIIQCMVYSRLESKIITIEVEESKFSPEYVHANVGDTLNWFYNGNGFQTITCDGEFPGTSLPQGSKPWDASVNASCTTYSYILQVAGSYNYVSKLHALTMTGRIVAESLLPVELNDFVATTIKNEVILDWSTSGEVNNDRFEIQRIELSKYRTDDPDDLSFVTIAIMNGHGTSNLSFDYRYKDKNLSTGVYLYRLKQVDFNSNYIYHLLRDEVTVGVPANFNVSQNFPNPFNPETKINFEIPQDGIVKVSVYDVRGIEVSVLLNQFTEAGYKSMEFNGTGFSGGTYFYRVEFKGKDLEKSVTKKMIMIK